MSSLSSWLQTYAQYIFGLSVDFLPCAIFWSVSSYKHAWHLNHGVPWKMDGVGEWAKQKVGSWWHDRIQHRKGQKSKSTDMKVPFPWGTWNKKTPWEMITRIRDKVFKFCSFFVSHHWPAHNMKPIKVAKLSGESRL